MLHEENFLSATEHFEQLVGTLSPGDHALYRRMVNTRPETGFVRRSFVVYDIKDRQPRELDNLTILDFHCDHDEGASFEIRSSMSGKTKRVGYTPVKLWDHDVFMFLPLHSKLSWSTTPSRPGSGSLGFKLLVRTMSRLHLRERGVTYCETGKQYAEEFSTAAA